MRRWVLPVESCPHASGGVPVYLHTLTPLQSLSPREWGCTVRSCRFVWCQSVVPTRVGVYRTACVSSQSSMALSPREWGCTACAGREIHWRCVVPTRVGVYRRGSTSANSPGSCPHASGGVPGYKMTVTQSLELSPREWGCTGVLQRTDYTAEVVPTRVGVYQKQGLLKPSLTSLSPREWGCT